MSDNEQTPSQQQSPGKPVLAMGSRIAIASAVVVLLCTAVVLAGRSFGGSSSTREIVVLDVSAIVNAQRAVLNKDPEEGRLTTLRVGKIAQEVIRDVAGENTVVLVKQAVVGVDESGLRDITEDVLRELQLPTDAAPTMKLPPAVSHVYTEQGQELLHGEAQRSERRNDEARAYEAERDKKNTLMP